MTRSRHGLSSSLRRHVPGIPPHVSGHPRHRPPIFFISIQGIPALGSPIHDPLCQYTTPTICAAARLLLRLLRDERYISIASRVPYFQDATTAAASFHLLYQNSRQPCLLALLSVPSALLKTRAKPAASRLKPHQRGPACGPGRRPSHQRGPATNEAQPAARLHLPLPICPCPTAPLEAPTRPSRRPGFSHQLAPGHRVGPSRRPGFRHQLAPSRRVGPSRRPGFICPCPSPPCSVSL